MSGIIGEAGSKSGVIGETTMKYEEGSFTPSFNQSVTTSGTGIVGYYVRKGNEVSFYAECTGTWSGTLNQCSGLPFNHPGPSIAGYGVCITYNNSTGGNNINRFEDNEMMYLGSAPGDGSQNRLFIMHGSYITDSP